MQPQFSSLISSSPQFLPIPWHYPQQQQQDHMMFTPLHMLSSTYDFVPDILQRAPLTLGGVTTLPYGHHCQPHDFAYEFKYDCPVNCFPNPYMDAYAWTLTGPEEIVLWEQEYINTCHVLLVQIEYYFSDANLVKDIYLRSNMDNEGWVSVDLISRFPRVKKWTKDKCLIVQALHDSTIVEVQEKKMRQRGNWRAWILPNGYTSSN